MLRIRQNSNIFALFWCLRRQNETKDGREGHEERKGGMVEKFIPFVGAYAHPTHTLVQAGDKTGTNSFFLPAVETNRALLSCLVGPIIVLRHGSQDTKMQGRRLICQTKRERECSRAHPRASGRPRSSRFIAASSLACRLKGVEWRNKGGAGACCVYIYV
jgi:hypothetical protein